MTEVTMPKKKYYGNGSLVHLKNSLEKFKKPIIFFDIFFKNNLKFQDIIENKNLIKHFIDTSNEPSTELINSLTKNIKNEQPDADCIVSIGGGSTLDVGKAVSITLKNQGLAEDYVGWDKVKKKSIYKIGIPTLFGTGSESTKTCVLLDKKKYLKLGINSPESVFDEIILDYSLMITAPVNQIFYTFMDTYIHSFESLNGIYRNLFADTCSKTSMNLLKKALKEKNLTNEITRSYMPLASYFGGMGIASSFVGLVHPMSAALSVVFGTKHCVSNCMVMRAMKEIYPKNYDEFWIYSEDFKIQIPKGICKNLSEQKYKDLYKATMIHDKPLRNQFGEEYKKKLTFDYLSKLFEKI